MKKTLTIFAALILGASAYAQAPEQEDNQLFNHWSVGVGLLEDLHFQVAGTITPNLQVRLVYNTFQPYIGIADSFIKKSPDIGSINPFTKRVDLPDDGIHQNGVNIDFIDLTAQFRSSEMDLFVDYFPSKTGSFHFTGGLIVDLSPNMLTASGVPGNNSGQPAIQPSDYGTKEIAGLTTDLEGKFNLRASYGLKTVRPYLGIGFGRAVDLKRRVRVTVDLGVAYIGGLHVYGESYIDNYPERKDVELNSAWMTTTSVDGKSIKEHIGKDADNVIKYTDLANGFPVLPCARFTITCRLF